MSNVEVTVVVEFNEDVSDKDYVALIELDDILNDYITTFEPSDKPYFRAHFSDNVIVTDVVSTDGGVVKVGEDSRTTNSELLFTSRDEDEPTKHTLPMVPSSLSASYRGRQGKFSVEVADCGSNTLVGDITATPFLLDLRTTYGVTIYKLIPPNLLIINDETYTIYVVFYLTLVDGES